ncbi:MAG: transposase [Anaerolineaceae bacterium]|nr:transposase [Anaerolineaceae bacterium]
MKLTAKVKLQPTKQQFVILLDTLKTANAACNDISRQAWERKTFKQFDIHHVVYRDIRSRYILSAQMTIRAIAKVADAYKLDKKVQRVFASTGGFAYDNRILSWKVNKQAVSIWTIEGRQTIPFLAGKRQIDLLKSQRGESDLVLIDGVFYLFAACDVDEPEPDDIQEYLGVDLGVANIATTSDGKQFAGSKVNSVRKRRRRQRRRLQKKGTKSARRRAKKLSGKEKRFANDINHQISKQLVEIAKRTGRGITLEDLKDIRKRIRARRNKRSWSFHDLGQKILYKARLAGVPVVFVDPAYTSQMCSVCGYIAKHNRTSQSSFKCRQCGHASNADVNAAVNISRLGCLSTTHTSQRSLLGTSPLAHLHCTKRSAVLMSAVGS